MVSLEVFPSISHLPTFSSHKVFPQSCFWLIQLKRSNMSVWAQIINLKDHPGFYSWWQNFLCVRAPARGSHFSVLQLKLPSQSWIGGDLKHICGGLLLTLQTAHWEHYKHSVFTPLYSSTTTLVTHSSIPSLCTLCWYTVCRWNTIKCEVDITFPCEIFFMRLVEYENCISCSPFRFNFDLAAIRIHWIPDNTIQNLLSNFHNLVKQFEPLIVASENYEGMTQN